MTSIKNHKGLLAFAAMLALGISSTGCLSSADETSEDPSAEENDALTSNTKAAFQFFVAKGLKRYQAAAIVGNLIQESSVNPSSVQFGGGPGRGIAQWSVGGRWDTDHSDNVHWYAVKKGQPIHSLNLQLEFVWYELETFSGYGLSKLKASSTITQATIAFQDDFEGCGQCDQTKRIAYAKQVLAAY